MAVCLLCSRFVADTGIALAVLVQYYVITGYNCFAAVSNVFSTTPDLTSKFTGLSVFARIARTMICKGRH
jgi:hypothetical protein